MPADRDATLVPAIRKAAEALSGLASRYGALAEGEQPDDCWADWTEEAAAALTAVGFFDQPTIRKDDSDGLVGELRRRAKHEMIQPSSWRRSNGDQFIRAADRITALEQQLAEAREGLGDALELLNSEIMTPDHINRVGQTLAAALNANQPQEQQG